MALTQTPFPNPMQVGVAYDDSAASVSDLNIQGAEGIHLHVLEIVNGGATVNYVKLYDLNNVTAGTSLPDFILPVVNGTTRTIFFFEDGVSGVTFTEGLSERCVQDAGTGGTTDPGGAGVQIGFWTSEVSS